jgi:hypothetical protein
MLDGNFSIAPMMEWTDRAEKQSVISTKGEINEPCCTKRCADPLSKRGQANDLAFPPSFGGRRISQRTTPVCAIALFRVSAMFIAKPKGKGANRWAR